MSPETLAILTNADVIAVDQDPLGIQGFIHSSSAGIDLYFKPLASGAWALCAFNRTARPQKLQFDWKKQKVVDDVSKRDARFDAVPYSLRDLWTKQPLGTTKDVLNAEIPSHDVLMICLDKARP